MIYKEQYALAQYHDIVMFMENETEAHEIWI
jgi:hypothetical protein